MKPLRNSVALALTGVALLALAIPALGQGSSAPESLLPPGFGDPVAPAPSRATPTPSQGGTGTRPQPIPSQGAPAGGITGGAAAGGAPVPGAAPAAQPTPDLAELMRFELPESAKRSTARVGIAGAGFAPNAFGRSDGRMLEVLMRRMDAPIASRWLSIVLRRALLSPVNTPHGVNGPDFAAERAWLLIRMGESTGARALVQSVDTENYTPKLFQVAMQADLASADPAGLCPLVDPAMKVSREPGWVLAQAMCAGLAGEPDRASELLDDARRAGVAGGIDLSLAEKIVGRGAGGKRDATIEWDRVSALNSWRWGLATATAQDIPSALMKDVRPQVWLWQALAPSRAPAERADAAERAAAQGVLSSAAYIDLFSAIDEQGEGTDALSIARDLRTASAATSVDERMAVLRALWSEPKGPRGRYARLVLTSRAAAAIEPASQWGNDAGNLIAALLAAGNDRRAMAWAPFAARGSDGWAMLALADPRPSAPVRYADADAYRGAASDSRKAQMLVAGLAGLGRMDSADAERLAQALDLSLSAENSWTRAIDSAAVRREPGTVVVLAAVGMQTGNWHGVPPLALYHITRAMRAVGLEGEARMIAAEAIARL